MIEAVSKTRKGHPLLMAFLLLELANGILTAG
jgi:hypothetical protein